jgi:hypothetical protein
MTRLDLEAVPRDVRQFVAALPRDSSGIELVLDGEVIWKLVRPGELSDAEKQIVLDRGRQLVSDIRERVKHIPPEEIKRKVKDAVAEVRRREEYRHTVAIHAIAPVNGSNDTDSQHDR